MALTVGAYEFSWSPTAVNLSNSVKKFLGLNGVKEKDTSMTLPETNPDTTSILEKNWFQILTDPTRDLRAFIATAFFKADAGQSQNTETETENATKTKAGFVFFGLAGGILALWLMIKK